MTEQESTAMSLLSLMLSYRDGDEIGWTEELAWLEQNHCDWLDWLEADVAKHGITEPILLGCDGRVWDGHHRIAVAVRLGLTEVPVVLAEASTREREQIAQAIEALDGALTGENTVSDYLRVAAQIARRGSS